MKLYATVDANGIIFGWTGTQADARADKKERGAAEWVEKEVPTSKPELMAFLNKYAIGCSIEDGVVFAEPEEEEDEDEDTEDEDNENENEEEEEEEEEEPEPAPKRRGGRR